MQRSVSKILTTHVGSLPFLSPDKGLAVGDESHLAEDVAAIVARQRETDIDIVNEGEFAKGGDWLRYMQTRFGGFTEIDAPQGKPLIEQGKDREEFAEFYKYASERGTLFYTPGAQMAKKRPVQACTGRSVMSGARAQKEIDFPSRPPARERISPQPRQPASKSIDPIATTRMTRTRPCASEAMRVSMRLLRCWIDFGVDDAWLPALWDRIESAWA